MFNNNKENISEIMNINVMQKKYNISQTLTRIKEYFLIVSTNFLFRIMFDNITLSFINIYN